MENNLVVLGIFGVLILFIAGCTGTAQGATKGNVSAGANEKPSETQPSPAQPPGGSPSPSPSGGKTDLNECLRSCNVLAKNDLVVTCQTGCYMGVAVDTKDITKCDQILVLSKDETLIYDTCIVNVATDLKDPSLCSKAKTEAYSNICFSAIAEAKLDASVCSGIKEDTSRDGCIYTVASKKKDPSICAMIKLDYLKESCMADSK